MDGIVLDTTDASPSDPFKLDSGPFCALCEVHEGGKWVLESRVGDGDWVPSDVSFNKTGQCNFWPALGLDYRFAGGSTGAKIRVVPTQPNQGGPVVSS